MYTKQRKATVFTVSNCMCLCLWVYLTLYACNIWFSIWIEAWRKCGRIIQWYEHIAFISSNSSLDMPKISRISLFQLNVTDIRNLISMETIWFGIHCVCYTLQIILIYKWEMIPIKMFVFHIIFLNRALFLNS